MDSLHVWYNSLKVSMPGDNFYMWKDCWPENPSLRQIFRAMHRLWGKRVRALWGPCSVVYEGAGAGEEKGGDDGAGAGEEKGSDDGAGATEEEGVDDEDGFA